MTPAARVAAAIGILDDYLAGESAERRLTTWARQNRYAGSGDRAAIRDLVFQAIRNRRSFAHLGGAESGRGLMIGSLRAAGLDPEEIFSGMGYAPPPLSAQEVPADRGEMTPATALDCPDWILPMIREAHGDRTAEILRALKERAPAFLRVNTLKTNMKALSDALLDLGVDTRPASLSPTALELVSNPRRAAASDAFREGWFEPQDAGSQWVADQVPVSPGDRVLDYCAGGGGKSLALAARVPAKYFAHDGNPSRMADLPARARRAGVDIGCLVFEMLARMDPFDVVLCDVPCSGSGAWRRAPEGKWSLTADGLERLTELQTEILLRAALLVGPGGTLVYVTCSLLAAENEDRVADFVRQVPDWQVVRQEQITPDNGADGFFLAILQRGSVDLDR